MMTRKELLRRINSLAQERARAAYRDEKAKLLQDVRQALADGQDVAAFLAHEERADLRAALPIRTQDAATRRAAKRGGQMGTSRRDASAPTKARASKRGRNASTR